MVTTEIEILKDEIKILKGKIEQDKDIKKEAIENSTSEMLNGVTKKYVTLFFSFDIVNSTQYKTIALQNSINIIREIFREIETLMNENIQIMQYWRTIGDEIIFYLEVYKIEEILESVEIVFSILNRVRKDILKEKIRLDCFDINYRYKYPELISLKATAWLAIVSDDDRETQNIKYKVGYMTNDKRLEFQGYDIDVGFRVAEYTRNRRFTLSFELAYLISKYERYKDNLKFIGYRKMKGVWNQRKYPIIWYHNKYLKKLKDEENLEDNDFILEDFNKSFFYDEEEFCELTKEYIKLNQESVGEKNFQDIEELLDKICKNLNLDKKMDEIYKTINEIKPISRNLIEGENLEFHITIICLNEKRDKILMFQRKNDIYDFGYVKLKLNDNFRIPAILEIVKKEYKEKFGVELEVEENIYKLYNLDKENKRILGFRIIGRVKSREGKITHAKYKNSFKEIDLTNYSEILYHRNANDFYAIITELLSGSK